MREEGVRQTVLQFGAGNIGRGFMGQVFTEAGYEVVFVDVVPEVVRSLNERRAYPLQFAGPDRFDRLEVGPVRAVDGRTIPDVARELRDCAFACTAVGVPALPHLMPALAAGIQGRSRPLNVILCENQLHCSALVREMLRGRVAPEDLERLGLVESVVSRMVPVVPEEERKQDPLVVLAEDYSRLPGDRNGFLGEIPPVPALQPVDNFAAYFDRKLYVHNLGHAVAAYLGYRHGCRYVYEAVGLPAVREQVIGAMEEAGRALCRKHGFDPAEMAAHQQDLLRRFGNAALRDTVLRVGRDPVRKLGPQDRLVGGALTCLDWDVEPGCIVRGIVAALRFDPPEDPGAASIQNVIREQGVGQAVLQFTGQNPGSELGRRILDAWEEAEGAGDARP
ncbi:MAG TPA: mannitol-1-phosphate 5-dehydrogenase [Armatimonadota bacterium]|nr:mannitol-1-phosphate 5-dehydrogenase [Armatimonadota bacterium]